MSRRIAAEKLCVKQSTIFRWETLRMIVHPRHYDLMQEAGIDIRLGLDRAKGEPVIDSIERYRELRSFK